MNMKRLLSLVAIFATLQASAQQVNPVPDYVFANRMSAGRNTVTDTAAYFSIGPRYGATRGMMPPMVVDTASFSGNKRNGLLIFSVQKNKFLYWDSVGVKWAEMAGTGGTAISSGDTASMLLPYVRHAGYGLTKSGQSFLVDTLNISTRAWRQKGLDSLAALEVSGSGTTNYIPKFTAASTIGNSIAYDNGSEFLINTIIDAGNYSLQNSGAFYNTGQTILAATSGNVGIGMIPSAFGNKYKVTQTTRGLSLYGAVDYGYYGILFNVYNDNNNNIYETTNNAGEYRFDIIGGTHQFYTATSGSSGTNATLLERLKIKNDGEIIIGAGSDAGAYNLQVTGAIYNTTTITTGAPTSGSAKPWKLGEAATVSPTSPNRTIRVEIEGVVYYLHAKTTND